MTGRYKLGDLVIPTSQGAEVNIPSLYMCVDGPSDEIEEADQGTFVYADQNVVFIQVYSSSLTNG